MSRLDDLIEELCPKVVESKALSDVGQLVRGNGMPKSDFTEAGAGAIQLVDAGGQRAPAAQIEVSDADIELRGVDHRGA